MKKIFKIINVLFIGPEFQPLKLFFKVTSEFTFYGHFGLDEWILFEGKKKTWCHREQWSVWSHFSTRSGWRPSWGWLPSAASGSSTWSADPARRPTDKRSPLPDVPCSIPGPQFRWQSHPKMKLLYCLFVSSFNCFKYLFIFDTTNYQQCQLKVANERSSNIYVIMFWDQFERLRSKYFFALNSPT